MFLKILLEFKMVATGGLHKNTKLVIANYYNFENHIPQCGDLKVFGCGLFNSSIIIVMGRAQRANRYFLIFWKCYHVFTYLIIL